ncbi:MAG: hypothetical protein M0R75_14695 [Dehalococcoidia bacterium]|nr:hypothetical protein [Dehalococcoidia bacterium]
MLLTLGSTSAYAQTSESQSNLGLATTLGPKFRVSGAQLLAGAPTGSVISLVWGGLGLVRVQLVCANAGGQTYVLLAVGGGADPVAAVTASGNYSSGAQYDIRGTYGAAGRSIGVYTTGGTLVASGSDTAITLPNADADNGIVRIGYPAIAAPGAMEGGAWYSQAPPANGDAPRATDSGILWAVLDNVVGQLVPGATALDDLDDASWGAGGTWDPPAPPEHSAAVTDTHPAQIDAASATADNPDHTAAVADANPAQTDAAGAGFLEPFPLAVSDANPMQTDGAVASAAEPGALVWGALGDSQTDEYQADDNRGPATVLNWWEILTLAGRILPGAWGSRSEPRRVGYAYNWARSSAQSPDVIADQLAGLAAQVAAGTVTHVGYMASGNDWLNLSGPLYALTIYNGDGTEDSEGELLSDIVQTFVDWHTTIMDAIDAALDTAGSGGGMVVMTPQDYLTSPPGREAFPDGTRRGWVTGVIEAIHAQVAAHAAVLNASADYTRFAVVRGDLDLLDVWATADDGHVLISGVRVDYEEGWEYDPETYDPYKLILSSSGGGLSHAGTLMGGEYARTFLGAANQLTGISIPQLQDAEVLAAAGIDAEHSAEASDVNPAQLDAASATGGAPDHSAAVEDANPRQVDAATAMGGVPAHSAEVADSNPGQIDSAAASGGAPSHLAAVADIQPAQVDSAAATGDAPGHAVAVADANPAQVDSVDASGSAPAHAAIVGDLHPAQIDSAAATGDEPGHSATVSDVHPAQVDAASSAHGEPEFVGAVDDRQPAQVDAVAVAGVAALQSAEISETNPLQTDAAAAGFSEAAHSALIAETNPMQVDSAAAPQIRPASAAADDVQPLQVDAVGIGVVPAIHEATVSDANPVQIDASAADSDAPAWLLEIVDWNPTQIDGAAIVQEIEDGSGDVTDWNPAQEDSAVGAMVAPVGVIIGETNPMQVDAAQIEHMPLVPIGPYRGVMSIQSRTHPLAIDSSAHILAIEEAG